MLSSLIETAKRVPGVERMTRTPDYRRIRHRMTLRLSRRQNRTFTRFMRVPGQYEALTGPVLEHVCRPRTTALRVLVVGCSNGAEAYTIAAVLRRSAPDLAVSVLGCDIEAQALEQARAARYAAEEVIDNPLLPPGFAAETFDVEPDGGYRVKREIAERVRFERGDALLPELGWKLASAPIVFAQNFLYHLRPRLAARAFRNIAALVESPGALFVDGMDLQMRPPLTRAAGLRPLVFKLEQIHAEAEVGRGGYYPYRYFGLEPFMTVPSDWQRRYATVFLRDPP